MENKILSGEERFNQIKKRFDEKIKNTQEKIEWMLR